MFWESFRAENFGKSGLFTPAHLSFSRCCRNTDKPSAPDVDNATTFPVAPTSTSYIPHARGPRLPGRTPKISHFPGHFIFTCGRPHKPSNPSTPVPKDGYHCGSSYGYRFYVGWDNGFRDVGHPVEILDLLLFST